jgi:hypothetical protein
MFRFGIGSKFSAATSRAAFGARFRSSANPAIREEKVPRIALVLGGTGLMPFLWYGSQHAPFPDVNKGGKPLGDAPWGDEVIAKWVKLTGINYLHNLDCHDQATVRHRFLTYAGSILSFLGAVHWGSAMTTGGPLARAQYVWSVIPSLWAWTALNLERDPATGAHKDRAPHLALSFGFLAAYMFDEFAAAGGSAADARIATMPKWYTFLRTPLTTAVVATTVTAAYLGRAPSPVERR